MESSRAFEPDLEEVLRYRNQDVVERCMADHGFDRAAADSLFLDMLRWLWLCDRHSRLLALGRPVPATLSLYRRQDELDAMWHTFLLFTEEYGHFCSRYFGGFIHHQPVPEREKRARGNEPSTPDREQLRAIVGFIYDELGAAVARRWFSTSREQRLGAEG